MAYRITAKDLDALCVRLNTLTASPAAPYARTESGLSANIGNYHISRAYGGYCLHRMANHGGAVHTVLMGGHVPAKELWYAIHAYIAGINSTKGE